MQPGSASWSSGGSLPGDATQLHAPSRSAVGVFWDTRTCPPPPGADLAEVIAATCYCCSSLFGAVCFFGVYAAASSHVAKEQQLLQRKGVRLTPVDDDESVVVSLAIDAILFSIDVRGAGDASPYAVFITGDVSIGTLVRKLDQLSSTGAVVAWPAASLSGAHALARKLGAERPLLAWPNLAPLLLESVDGEAELSELAGSESFARTRPSSSLEECSPADSENGDPILPKGILTDLGILPETIGDDGEEEGNLPAWAPVISFASPWVDSQLNGTSSSGNSALLLRRGLSLPNAYCARPSSIVTMSDEQRGARPNPIAIALEHMAESATDYATPPAQLCKTRLPLCPGSFSGGGGVNWLPLDAPGSGTWAQQQGVHSMLPEMQRSVSWESCGGGGRRALYAEEAIIGVERAQSFQQGSFRSPGSGSGSPDGDVHADPARALAEAKLALLVGSSRAGIPVDLSAFLPGAAARRGESLHQSEQYESPSYESYNSPFNQPAFNPNAGEFNPAFSSPAMDEQQLAATLQSSFDDVGSGSEPQLRKLIDIFGDVPTMMRFLAMQCRCDQVRTIHPSWQSRAPREAATYEMTRALAQNLEMPPDAVLVSQMHKFCEHFVPKVRLDLQRAAELGIIVLSGLRHAEWVAPSMAARHAFQRPYGRHVPIARLFSGNPTQMQWMKEVFGDVATLFHFLLTEVRVKGTLPASVPPFAVPKGKLINLCVGSHVHFDFDAAIRTQLVMIGGRNPYEWVRIAAADGTLLGNGLVANGGGGAGGGNGGGNGINLAPSRMMCGRTGSG
ncbi:hypothetical protein T492DRAFT_832982 [Pavlovales sp. CCMP2436]|nr:hypothetical protein T492DRAFT_832982 [Pavlovales sp. CCMP2436]